MRRSTTVLICTMAVLLNALLLTLAQNTPSYTYSIVADLPSTPDSWANGTFSTLDLDSDDSIATINFDFPFQFFSSNYTSIALSSNGNAQFATSSTGFSPPTLPTTSSLLVPLGAFFFTDMDPTRDSSGPIIYKTEGVAPFRSLTIRYQNVTIIGSDTDFLFVEVVLFENNTWAWRYYGIPLVDGRDALVGVQGDVTFSDGSYDYTVIWNDNPMNQTLSDLLLGKTVYWSIPPIPVPANFSTGSSGEYDVSITSGVASLDVGDAVWTTVETGDDDADEIPIGFSFSFFGVQYENITMVSNGYLHLGESTLATTTGQAMPSGNVNQVPLIAAFWADLYPVDNTTLEYTTFGTPGALQFVARWSNITYYGNRDAFLSFDVILHQDTGVIEIHYNQIDRYSTNILIGIQLNTVNDAANPSYAYLVNAVRIDTNNLYSRLNGSTLTFTPTGIIPPTGSSTGMPEASSSSANIPEASSSSSTGEVIPPVGSSSSSGGVIPTQSSSSSSTQVPPTESSSTSVVPPTESSSTGVLPPTESSSTAVLPPVESSSSGVLPPSESSSSMMATMSSSSSSVVVIPVGCSFTGQILPGTLVVEILISSGVESLGPNFGPSFLSVLVAFFSTTYQNAVLPTFGCGSVIGFGNRIGNIAPSNENESVVRVLVVPASNDNGGNETVVTPDQASQTMSDPNLSTSMTSAGLPSIQQTQLVGKQCPDGRQVGINDSCDNGDDDDDGLTDGQLAGVIVGSVVGGLLLIALLVCCLLTLRKRKSYSSSSAYGANKSLAARGRGVEMGEYDRTEVV